MVQWTEKLRPCAEALYIVLFENHSQVGHLQVLYNFWYSFVLLSQFPLILGFNGGLILL